MFAYDIVRSNDTVIVGSKTSQGFTLTNNELATGTLFRSRNGH